jgi:allantoinase
VVTPSGIRAAHVIVSDGRILDVVDTVDSRLPVEDLGEAALLPGIVDCHAHVNEPGRTDWEGFATATLAAAAGGITTLVDMPLNSIPATTTRAALATKAKAAKGQCAVDYGFWGGVIPGNQDELLGMVDAGALGFKAFLIHSGVDEFPMSRREDLNLAMPKLAQAGVPLLVHAEKTAHETEPSGDPHRYATFLASRPPSWEVDAIRMMIALCREHRCRVHVVHLSAADALEDLQRAKDAGLPITVETCPHYLTFAAEEIPDGATHFKCAPPIREAANRERLWEAVRSGLIDLVVSDHSPCTPMLKKLEEGDFAHAWGGIAGLQFSMSAVWSGMRARGMDLSTLAERMALAPARLAGLDHRKGSLEKGKDADLLVFDPEGSRRVLPDEIRHRHKVSPYIGKAVAGRVLRTVLRGEPVFDGQRASEEKQGAPLGERLFRAPR